MTASSQKVVLISCVSKKRSHKTKASDLYISPLFKSALAYAQKLNPDAIYILSAKHGLLALNTEVEPYNVTLNQMTAQQKKEWAGRVLAQLAEQTNLEDDHFVFLAGQNYRKYLIPHLNNYEVPLESLPIGKQLQYLNKMIK